jgi:membrane-associated phospholipid phosphatase
VGVRSDVTWRVRQAARPAWYLEAAVLGVGYVGFGLARAAVDHGNPAATSNALLVQQLERALHIAIEQPLNQAMLTRPAAMVVTGYSYRLCLLTVPIVLIWLYVRRPERYRQLRTVLVVTTLLDLPLVWLFPESPPRFAQPGIVDYIATNDILFGAASRTPSSGVNLLAAMPSMHVAWMTWCGYALWSSLRERRPRAALLAWLPALLIAVVVLVSGHHYVLDVLAGAAVVAAAVRLVKAFPADRRLDEG